MKKIITTSLIAMLVGFAATAQDKKVAVFDPAGKVDEVIKEIVREEISTIFVNASGYTVLRQQRVNKVLEENSFQRSSLADNSQISEMGKRMGANLVFVSSVTKLSSNYYVSCKMIDVQTAGVTMQRTAQTQRGMDDLIAVVQKLVGEILFGAPELVATAAPPQTQQARPVVADRPQTQPARPSTSAHSQVEKTVKERIAVMPFEGVSHETNQLAQFAEDKTTAVFYSTGRVIIVERSELNKILEEQKFSQSGLVEEAAAVEMGNLSGAKFVVTGKVTSTGYNTEWKTLSYKRKDGSIHTEHYQVENGSVGMQIKMIDVANGEVVLSKAYNFSDSNSRTLKGRESVWASALTRGIGRKVSKEVMNFFPIEGTIVFVDGKKSVTIDIGSEYGIKKGMRVEVISTRERTNTAGRTIKITTTIAKLQVTDVTGEESSVCKISDGRVEDLEEGMSVILKAEQSFWAGENSPLNIFKH